MIRIESKTKETYFDEVQSTRVRGGEFEIERDDCNLEIKISDDRIRDDTTLERRAKAEFLNRSYDKKVAVFSIPFDENIDLNDIIEVNAMEYGIPQSAGKNRYIVKGIRVVARGVGINMVITGERYD